MTVSVTKDQEGEKDKSFDKSPAKMYAKKITGMVEVEGKRNVSDIPQIIYFRRNTEGRNRP